MYGDKIHPRFEIKSCDFGEVLPMWRDYLWVGRKTDILGTNPLKFMGGYDREYHLSGEPVFWKITDDEQKIVGVNSGLSTERSFRSRGLWVAGAYRGQGLSGWLFAAVEEEAQKRGAEFIWSLPRLSALPAYLAFGFKQCSNVIDDATVEFGPNCFVRKDLVK